MSRKHKAGVSFLHEVNAGDVVTLKKDELPFLFYQWSQKWADPGYEGYRPVDEEFELLKSALEDK